jgi:endonuclease YncB( thermonuclease family)
VDVTIRRRDRYGRAVARIQAPNGKDINEQLVREGQCWWYRQYAPRDERLAHAEAWARAERRGVWTDPNPTPPWIWRKQHQR